MAYIEWGEDQDYHRRSTIAARQRWYDLGNVETAFVLMNKMIDVTSRTFLAEDAVFANNVLYEIHSDGDNHSRICVAANSTFCQLIINTEGRTNFGGGMLELAAYELEELRIVNPALLAEPKWSAFNAADWDVLNPSAARRHVDGLVYDALGLTAGEQDAVHAGVAELVGNRKRRARSLAGPASAAPQKQKEPFKVVPISGGFAPGVDPYNLKQLLDKEDIEKYLRENAQ